jgi:Domain of unknown function (DUF3291)
VGGFPVGGFDLAQLNVARLLAPINSPQLADFVAALDEVNALADAAPGFRWRLQDESGNATAVRPWGADVIVNMSVWDSVDSLRAYVYAAGHVEVLRRRREWFVRVDSSHLVLWWVPAGHRPTLVEARERLAELDRSGPTPKAFTLREPFGRPTAGSTTPTDPTTPTGPAGAAVPTPVGAPAALE